MLKDEELGHVFTKLRRRLMKTVSRIVPPNDIEDIVQETYVRVCQIENKQSITYPRAFMVKTARNLAIDHLKRAESRLTSGVENEEEFDLEPSNRWVDESYQRAASNNDFSLFCEAVRKLPRQCRRAFVLKKVYGYSQKEIAQRLDITQSTVEKHISTGIKRCTHFMNRHTDYGQNKSSNSTELSNEVDALTLPTSKED